MKLRPLLLTVFSALLVCPSASAEEYDAFLDGNLNTGRFYIAGTAGLFANYDVEDGDAIGGGDFEYDLSDGTQYAIAIGSYFGSNRIEFEVATWQAELTQINPAFPGDNDTGDFEYLTFMFNVYGDAPLAGEVLQLYFGGGAGVARVDAGFNFSPPLTSPTATITALDDEQYTFAAQGMIGLTYNITPNLAVTSGYRARYIAATKFDTNQNLRSDIIHSVDVGLRISF